MKTYLIAFIIGAVLLCIKAAPSHADILKLITKVALETDIDPALLMALVEQESSFNYKAGRLEPHLIKKFGSSEKATSWGLTQVVLGYHEKTCLIHTVTDLLVPINNLRCGAKVLKICINKTDTIRSALSCYNGDKTGKYASMVMARYIKFIPSKQHGYTK